MSNLKDEIILLANKYCSELIDNYDVIEDKLKKAMLEYNYNDFLNIYEELFALGYLCDDDLINLDYLLVEHPDKSYIQLYFFAKRIVKYLDSKVYCMTGPNDNIYTIADSREDLYKFIFGLEFKQSEFFKDLSSTRDKVTFYFMGNSAIHKDKIIAYSENDENHKSKSIYLYTEDDLLKEIAINI